MIRLLLTKNQLAKELNISESKIDYDMRRGLPYKKRGKSIRFIYVDVIDYYRSRRSVVERN